MPHFELQVVRVALSLYRLGSTDLILQTSSVQWRSEPLEVARCGHFEPAASHFCGPLFGVCRSGSLKWLAASFYRRSLQARCHFALPLRAATSRCHFALPLRATSSRSDSKWLEVADFEAATSRHFKPQRLKWQTLSHKSVSALPHRATASRHFEPLCESRLALGWLRLVGSMKL